MILGVTGRSVLCPSPLPRCGWWRRRRRRLGGLRPVVLRRRVHCGVDAAPVVGVIVAVGGRRRGGAGRLAEFLAGVRRTSIVAGRYKAGWRWTRLSTAGGRGWRQRRRLGRRSRGRGTRPGVAGDGDGRGLDDHSDSADAPPSRFRGGSLLPPLVNVPVDGDGSTVRGDQEVEE